MDFLLLTQANHTIYDYGSFGFWGAVLAGGTTMLADGYRLAFLSYYFSVACWWFQLCFLKLIVWTSFLQRQAASDPCGDQETTSEGLDQSWCFLDTTATAKAGPRSDSMRICANAKGTWLTSKPQTFMLSTVGWHLCPEYKNTFQLHLSANCSSTTWLVSRGFCILNRGLTSLSKIQEYIPAKFKCHLYLCLDR